MLDSFKTHITFLYKFAKTFTHPLKTLKKMNTRKRRKLISSTDHFNSSISIKDISKQLRQVFNYIDLNGDGKISPSELSQLLLRFGQEKSTATKEAEVMVRELDYNGNGFIDVDEFLDVFLSKSHNKICYETEDGEYLLDAFRIYDTDMNGLISAKELHKVLKSLGFDNCSLQDCTRMIKGVDKDGDGFVDFEEFRLMMIESSNAR